MRFFSLITLLTLFSYSSFAQLDLGLKIMPNIAFNSVNDLDNDDSQEVTPAGAGVRFGLGIVGDYFFGDNYALSFGINYMVKRSGIEISGEGSSQELIHNLQMVQIPIGLKFYTNEIATDIQMYFNVAGTIDIKVGESMIESPGEAYKDAYENSAHYRPLDLGGILAVGAEMGLGESTKAFGGLFYNPSFLSLIRDEVDVDANDAMLTKQTDRREDVSSRLQLIGVEAGIKF